MLRYIGSLIFILFFSLFILQSCEKFEFNPYQVHSKNAPANLNEKNLNKLFALVPSDDDTVTILFTSDSQDFYEELDELVNVVNKIPHIDFLLLSGDISEFGLLREYNWIDARLEKLYMPYFGVIGNHDFQTSGSEIFEQMFGEKNFSFKYKGYKFLLHDTNSREYNFNGQVPDINWLATQLNDKDAKWFVGVSHVPPFQGDFDQSLMPAYVDLFSSTPGFILSLHGHLHTCMDSVYYHDHVRYIISNALNRNSCLLIKLYNGEITTQLIPY